MLWFRSHIRAGSHLALFALAVQFVVTFSHVHLDGLAGGQPVSAAAGHAALSQSGSGVDRQVPGTADTDCPICALIQLMSSSAPSVAPPLPVPATYFSLRLEVPDELRWAASPHFAFHARGPPAA